MLKKNGFFYFFLAIMIKNTKKYKINYWTKINTYDTIKSVNIIDFRQWGLMKSLYIDYIIFNYIAYLYMYI